MMRKLLFWLLIVLLVFLLIVLGVAFYQDKKPLHVLQNRFGVQQNTVVREETTPRESSSNPGSLDTQKDNQSEQTPEEEMKEMIKTEESQGEPTQGSANNGLSEQEKKETKTLIDSLFKSK